MKKIVLILLMSSLFFIGTTKTNAQEISDDFVGPIDNEVVVENVKYFKTVTLLNNSETLSLYANDNSFTAEISEEEYNASENDEINANYVDTSTKKLTVRISKNGNNYQYTAITDWHQIPTLKSYHSIGIGHYPSVKNHVYPHFKQVYCYDSSTCYTQEAGFSLHESNTGSAATYYMPSGDLTYLQQTFYVVVTKTDSSNTIVSQYATASYGQPRSAVSYNEAKDFFINTGGLNYDSAHSKYLVNSVSTTWSGTW